MTDVRRRLRLLVVALVTLAAIAASAPSALAAPASSQPCPDESYSGSTAPSEGQSASARPVILVHGWTGGPMTGTATKLQQMLGDQISTFTFDYSGWASHWANNVHIASCLADYIGSVSSAYRSVGGDGRVLMVAHSMGGLAIRYALDPRFARNPVTTGTIAGVVTLSTPYGGSPYGGSAFARFKEVASQYLGGADLPGTGAGDGGACLVVHSGGETLPDACGAAFAPYYPAGVPVTQIAGNVSVNRTIFGFKAYSLPLGGDSIVQVPSSQGYLTSGPDAATPRGQHTFIYNDNCSINQDVSRVVADPDVIAVLGKALAIEKLDSMTFDELNSNRLGPLEMAQDAYGLLAGCSHIHISTDHTAMQELADALKAEVAPTNPSDGVEWWGNQTIPTGWESGETLHLRDGRVVSCSTSSCQYSVQSLSVQPAAPGREATATIVLFVHDSDGFPLAQTLLVLAADTNGLVLRSASDTSVSLPANRALCRRTTAVLRPNGDVEQTFANCPDPSGAGVQVWHLSGARLSLG